MKKKYIKPEVKVEKIEICKQLCDGSLLIQIERVNGTYREVHYGN